MKRSARAYIPYYVVLYSALYANTDYSVLCTALYANTLLFRFYLLLYMQSVRIIYCFIYKSIQSQSSDHGQDPRIITFRRETR